MPNSRRRKIGVAVVAALLLWSLAFIPYSSGSLASVDDSTLVSTSTREGRLQVFDDVWETIEERYYDSRLRGIDWQAKRTTYRPEAADAPGTQEFYEVLRQMVGSLKDAHTRVYSPEEKFDWWNPRFVTVGLTVREIDHRPIVTMIDPDSAPARAGIKRGDVITSIDNTPAAKVIERKLQNSSFQSFDSSARFHVIASLLEGPAGTSLTLGWQARDGKIRTTVVPRYWNQRHLGFRFRREGKIAIIALDVFTQSVAFDFVRALPKIVVGVDGIVLDLRSNGGGDAEAMADVASTFLGDGINLGRFADRAGSYFELQTNARLLSPLSRFFQTRLPLVVLTSENTSSAAEILAAALQTTHRARIMGNETCGCVLAIRNRHTLPDGGVLDVSEFDYRTGDGVRLEGLGVKPDQTVSPNRKDIYSQRDRAVELASAFLHNNEGR